ncbi:MAG: M23 family metallopeptidase [Oscillospiraceae bacterium]|nr:M23 family metallopeptidase [Oscillospiraceae bacterium]
MVTASWKTEPYRQKFGTEHYGMDLISRARNRTLWGSGRGTVVSTGKDSVVGNVVAVMYPAALNRKTGQSGDVVFRYFHLESISVRIGQSVTKDTRLGFYGNTGMYSTGAHLHLEADTDTAFPLYSPTVLRSSFLMGRAVGAHDKTMTNPADWLYCKTSAPDRQSWETAGGVFIRLSDRVMENIV